MEPIMLVSALYGGYDEPPALPLDLDMKSVIYTDNPHLYAKGWDEVRVVNHGLVTLNGDPRITGPMLAHKYWKMFGGKDESSITVWMDASMTIVIDDFTDQCVALMEDAEDLILMPHPWRDCIYDEADYSASLPRYESLSEQILQQAEYYRSLGHPEHDGLFASGLYIRRNNAQVGKLMADWWWECITRTHQDQISLPVVLALNPEVDYWRALPWHDDPGCWTHLGQHLK